MARARIGSIRGRKRQSFAGAGCKSDPGRAVDDFDARGCYSAANRGNLVNLAVIVEHSWNLGRICRRVTRPTVLQKVALAVSREERMVSGRRDAMSENRGQKRICVVTPYFREDREVIARCLDSVNRQTVPVDHLLVADGFPQAWLDGAGVRHIRLDKSHGDYGNVGRGLGALMAIAEKYEAIAFLDADNWYEPDHIESCLAALAAVPEAPYVVARRDFVRPDGAILPLPGTEDLPHGDHVDTNCYLLLPPTFPLLHYWCSSPREFAAVGDRLFRLVLKTRLGPPAIVSDRRTVKYLCLFEALYRAVGEAPPPGAKPSVDWSPAIAWLGRLSGPDRMLVDQLAGLTLSQLVRDAA